MKGRHQIVLLAVLVRDLKGFRFAINTPDACGAAQWRPVNARLAGPNTDEVIAILSEAAPIMSDAV